MPLTPHLRPPTSSRANSSQTLSTPHLSRPSTPSGSRSHSRTRQPHPQHREYVPSGMSASIIGGATGGDDGVTERWMLDEAEAARSDTSSYIDDDEHEHLHVRGDECDPEADRGIDRTGKLKKHQSFAPDVDIRSAASASDLGPEVSEADRLLDDDFDGEERPNWDWDNLRDGSISRRPPWRRPTPKWILPFILGATISLGMTMAPKAELLIDLACLAHPPQQSSSLLPPHGGHGHMHGHKKIGYHNEAWASQPWKGTGVDINLKVLAGNMSITDTVLSQKGNNENLSPADKWFLRLQHEMYEYKVHHHLIDVSTPTDDGSSTASAPSPTKPSTTPSIPKDSPGGIDSPSPSDPVVTPSPTIRPGDSTPIPHPSSPSGGGNTPYHEIDPRLCKKDPKVQGSAAKINMIMISTMGILSAMTTGFWGQTSDRVGRRRILATVELGLLLADVCFLLVASFPYLAPGGYYSLLIGPFFEGLLGGISTITATAHAYVSDVTPDGSRATAFARLSGALMVGFACGPVLGSSLIQATNNILAPFYVSVCVHAIYIPLILILLPESLSSEARAILTKNAEIARAAAKRRDEAERQWENAHWTDLEAAGIDHSLVQTSSGADGAGNSSWSRLSTGVGRSRTTKRAAGRVRRLLRRMFAFLHPLTIFWPQEKEDGSIEWNLTRMGIVMACISMMYGILGTKTQYTFYAYGWTSAEVGPYMSFMSVCRVIVLLVIMPIAMYFAKPYFREKTIIETSDDPSSGISSTSAVSDTPDHTSPANAKSAKIPKTKRSAALDIIVLRTCLFIEFTFYGLIALTSSPNWFIFFSGLLTFGSPGSPAANSLALSFLPSSREAGRLFGGLAVIHAIGATFLSPILFGTLFAYTVGWYAAAVFVVASAIVGIGFMVSLTVRIPKIEDVAQEGERGRRRAVKQVRSSSRVRAMAGEH